MWVNKEEEQDPYSRNPNNTNLTVGSGGGNVAPTPGSNTPNGNPSTVSPINTNKTQNFATIQDYLGANKQQGEDLGQKVTSSLSDQQNKEKGNIDTAANNITNSLNTSSVYNPDIVNSSIENPTATVNDPNKLSTFLNQWNGNYSGPNSFESTTDYNKAAESANEAGQKAEQLKTTGGREQLLQDQFGVYGQGNKGLDQAILQNSGAFPQIQEQGKGFGSIQDYLSSKANDIDTGAIPLAKQNVASNAAKAQSDFGAGVKGFENQVNNEATSQIDPQNKDLWNSVAQAYVDNPGNVVGPTPQNPGVDLARYLTATPEERAKYAGLSRLSGKPNNFFPTYAQTPALGNLSTILNTLKKK